MSRPSAATRKIKRKIRAGGQNPYQPEAPAREPLPSLALRVGIPDAERFCPEALRTSMTAARCGPSLNLNLALNPLLTLTLTLSLLGKPLRRSEIRPYAAGELSLSSALPGGSCGAMRRMLASSSQTARAYC